MVQIGIKCCRSKSRAKFEAVVRVWCSVNQRDRCCSGEHQWSSAAPWWTRPCRAAWTRVLSDWEEWALQQPQLPSTQPSSSSRHFRNLRPFLPLPTRSPRSASRRSRSRASARCSKRAATTTGWPGSSGPCLRARICRRTSPCSRPGPSSRFTSRTSPSCTEYSSRTTFRRATIPSSRRCG